MRGEKTVLWQLRQAEKRIKRYEKLIVWFDGQLTELLAGIEAEQLTLKAELDAIDGEKHPEPVKKQRKKREKKA